MKAKLQSYAEPQYWSTIEGSEEIRRINDQIDRITFGASQSVPGEREARRLRFTRILVGWDGSSHADRALQWGIALARVYGGSVDLASVVPQHGANELYRQHGLVATEDAAANERVLQAAQRAKRLSITIRTHVFHGSPAHELCEAARRLDSSLLVVGSRGLSRAAELVLGGTATAAINEAPVNVLVARTAPPARRVLVPTDGSIASQEAALVASDLQRAWKIRGTLLHVVPPPSFGPPEPARKAFNRLFASFGKNEETGTQLDVDVQFGRAARHIADTARKQRADLILMGSRGLSRVRSLVAGSVSSGVLHRATGSSVLLVKEP